MPGGNTPMQPANPAIGFWPIAVTGQTREMCSPYPHGCEFTLMTADAVRSESLFSLCCGTGPSEIPDRPAFLPSRTVGDGAGEDPVILSWKSVSRE